MRMILNSVVAAVVAGALAAQTPAGVVRRAERAEVQVVAGSAGLEMVAGQLVGGSPVKGEPYSAEAVTETSQTLADGNRIARRSSSMVYRDSEGRERREMSLAGLGTINSAGEPGQAVFISDPVAGTNYSLETKNRIAHKMPAMPPLAAPGKAPTGDVMFQAPALLQAGLPVTAGGPQVMFYKTSVQDAAAPEQLGTRIIEGVLAEGTRTTMTIPAGQIGNERAIEITSERWYSPELKVTVLSKHSDPRSGETVYSLTNINRTEPLRSLFEVPPDYTVRDIPEVRRFERKTGQQ